MRRAALAAAAAGLLLAGHPPVDLALAGPLALVPLLALARDLANDPRARLRTAVGWGFVAGIGFFGPLLWFLERFGVVPWLLLTLIQAASVAAFLAGVVAWGDRPGRPVMAVVWWVALEAVRSAFPFGGFSWGVLGYTQHDGGVLLPLARVVGVLGVSAACVALAVAVEEALHRLRRPGRSARGLLGPVAGGLAVLTLGALAAVAVPPPAPTGRTVDIAAVQGDADIRASSAAGVAREDVGRIVRVAQEMVQATRPLAGDPPAVTVWPENALDADLRVEENVGVRAAVADALDILDGQPLLSGMFLRGPRDRTLYNAMVVLTPQGVGDTYLKRKPVPFAEYIPARSLFDWYPALDQIPSDMLPGETPGVIDVAGARIGGVICFENIFPELVRDQVLEGANVLVVSTNNSSWGSAAASEQHLTFTQLRAVETGRWALHAGLSGITAVVDPSGGVTQETEIFEHAIVRADLPLIEGHTPATRLAGLTETLVIALALAGIAALLLTRRSAPRKAS